jgi:hypothetical protein
MLALVATLAAGDGQPPAARARVESAERARSQSAWVLSGRARLGTADPARRRRARQARSTTSASPGPCRWPRRGCRPSSRPTASRPTPTRAPRPFSAASCATCRRTTTCRTWSPPTASLMPARSPALQRLCLMPRPRPTWPRASPKALAAAHGAQRRHRRAAGCRRAWPSCLAAGIDDASVALLAEVRHASCRQRTPINLNTAPREVLVAGDRQPRPGQRRTPGAAARTRNR